MTELLATHALEHPLPAGMRDLLPLEVAVRRAIARAFLEDAELRGYEHVIPPVFEYESTIERGLGHLDPREIVRFIEPETGEVVALRPDVTPQIARVVATRLGGKPPPYRIAYDASVVRRRAGSRARTHRQVSQVGAELVGEPSPRGDVELVVLAASVLSSLGLPAFTIDLGHADIARALLASVPDRAAVAIAEALSRKDGAELDRQLGAPEVSAALTEDDRQALASLPLLHGSPGILAGLPAVLLRSSARGAIAALAALAGDLATALARERVEGVDLSVDLGEVRGLAYYTGPFFQIFAEGPGVAIGAGGRYDQLLGRFGRTLPATGLALDVDALAWAIEAAGISLVSQLPRLCVGGPEAEAAALSLRRTGLASSVVAGDFDAVRAWASAWGCAAAVWAEGGGATLARDDSVSEVAIEDVARLVRERAGGIR